MNQTNSKRPELKVDPHFESEQFSKYLTAIEKLDEVLSKIARSYCKDECPKKDKSRCCASTQSHECGIEHLPVFKKNQMQEALQNGANLYGKKACKFLENELGGCTLKKYKAPVCIGFLCDELKDHIVKSKYPEQDVKQFIEVMTYRIYLGSLKSNQNLINITNAINTAIESGQKIITYNESIKQNQHN